MNIQSVYELIHLPGLKPEESKTMKVIYRLAGADGEATEPIITKIK